MKISPLELLALVMLSRDKERREAVDTTQFTGEFARLFDEFKRSPGTVLQAVLGDIGINWDGKTPLTATVVSELLSRCQFEAARKKLSAELTRMKVAEHTLRFPAIAGKENVDKAVQFVREASWSHADAGK